MNEAFNADEQQRVLEDRAQLALDYAASLGATACEVGASVNSGLEVAVRLGEVETMSMARDQGIGITVYIGQHEGSASTSDNSESALRETVERACDIARFTAADPAGGLADASLLATSFPDLELYHPWGLTPDQAIELALRCESAGREKAGIVNSEGASISSSETVSVYANSAGFLHGQISSGHSLACALIARDGSGMQRDYDYTTSRVPGELLAPELVGKNAAERTLRRLDPQKVMTGRYPVLFAPSLSVELIQHLLQAISGGAQYRQSSFLYQALGEKVLPEWFSLCERPHEKRALGSANFDNEGVATRDNCFIDRGIISTYMLSCYSARRLGLATSGNAGGAHNIRIDAEHTGYHDLLAGISRGVLVTELMGQGVNPVTGDYSRGAAGFWVENGKIQYPVEGFTIASNLRDMYAGLLAVGDDIDTRGNAHSGSWLIDAMTVAG